jgi:putative ABC transport system ATP-binding protein
MPMIRLKKLKRVFQEGRKELTVFSELDLDIHEGEIVVLLGRSGSGKSTLLNLISGIDLPDAGTIQIDSIDVTGLSEHHRTLFRRRHIGFIFQFFNLIPTLSVLENLLLPIDLNQDRSTRSDDLARELLMEVGLTGREDSYPDRLSGGEQQRVAIARALVHQPKIVLADEPTGNLDKETGLEILQVLDTQVRKAGKTMVMATHSREVIGLADRIIRFTNGGLQEMSPKDVL